VAITIDLTICYKKGDCYKSQGCPAVFGNLGDGTPYVKDPNHPVDACVLRAKQICCSGAIQT